MAAPRIIYFVHDNPAPSGGVWTIYSHVAHLNRNGFSAFVAHGKPGFRPGWFEGEAPTIYYDKGLPIDPADVLVIPENFGLLERLKTTPVKKVVFCQNHFFAFSALPVGESWKSLGATHVLASSEVIADFVRTELGWTSVPVVHYAVDHSLFKPAEKKRQIACMPRKCPHDFNFIRGLVRSAGGTAAAWEWAEIDGVSFEKSAAILSESAVFLSLSRLEGFGLPPVEAMASGCGVVGYHGYGGLEYAREDNGFWCDEGNPMACARMVRDVMEMFDRGDGRIASTIEAGIRTAARYGRERQEEEVVSFMRGVLGESLG